MEENLFRARQQLLTRAASVVSEREKNSFPRVSLRMSELVHNKAQGNVRPSPPTAGNMHALLITLMTYRQSSDFKLASFCEFAWNAAFQITQVWGAGNKQIRIRVCNVVCVCDEKNPIRTSVATSCQSCQRDISICCQNDPDMPAWVPF